MRNRSSTVESREPPAGAALPHTLFILPELEPKRLHDLTILILADGNRRSSSSSGGYAGGARRVVSIAEHLARRQDVATMVACILSPDNIAKRGDGFFFELYKEFIQLGVEIATTGVLVAAGVRMELWGDTGSLRARGGHAALLADAVEAVAAMTTGPATPALRLILGIGYGRDTARELDVDIVLRTGMEEPGVLRLSGLRTCAGIANCATATLWPDVEPREVDEVIELCVRRMAPRFAGGHGVSAIVDLILALARADIDPAVRVTITTSTPPATVSAALERLFAGPLHGCATIAVELALAENAEPEHHGQRGSRGSRGAVPHVVRIVSGAIPGGSMSEGELLSVLAPGQQPLSFMLPDWLPLGHANVHACATTAQDLVEGIRAATRFSAAHPPLLGRDRVLARAGGEPASGAAPEGASATDRDELADRFAARTLEWAASAGLGIPGAAWQTAARNYALTAFFIHFRIPTEWDRAGALWEERAELTAKYMILVAAGDEGIFDRILDGETPEQRWARLEVSSRYLKDALRSEEARAGLPSVPGAELLFAIKAQWQELGGHYLRACLPAAEASFRAGLEDLYAASLTEHRAGIAADPLAGRREPGSDRGRGRGRGAVAEAMEERFAAAPRRIAARARALAGDAEGGSLPGAANELRALLYLTEVSGAIGAGLLFRTAALAAPAASVTSRSIACLDAAATLLDYHVRLSNDVSGFLGSPGGDRDPKANTCTILVPASTSGAARAAAVVQALATCRRLAGWLGGEIAGAGDRLAAEWPSMGVIFRRGVFVGRRVYEVGHYTTVSRAEMSAIFDEAEEALG